MGRKRQNRKQRTGQIDSEMSLNGGDISSDTDSESSVIHRPASNISMAREMPVQRSADDDQNAQSSAEIQDNASTSQTYSPLRDNIRDVNIQDAHAGQGLPSVSTGQSPQTENTIAGSGDELPSQSNGDSMKFNIMAHTLLSRISQQNETQNTSLSNMLKECLTGVTSIVRENSASMNECMKSIANMVQESNLQLCNLVKENRLQLSNLSERLDTVRNSQASVLRETTPGTTNNFQSHEVTSQTPCLTLPSVVSAISTNYTAAFSTVQNRPTVSNPVATAHSDCHHSVIRSSQSCISVPTHSHNSVHSMNDSGNETASRGRNVKLPAFTGNSQDNWKVWFSRFTTVADLNKWNETTRLSELVQRLQGTAAEFVFDEIPSDSISNFHSLVRELSLRFQSVETNKTFRVQFNKRVQRVGESVEDYSAELKRLYDKAYPGKNPEMRRQLLLQQFLNGLRDKQAKFAVEYFKEPCTIEEAIHNVVTYMEAQQNPKYETSRPSERLSKTVRFQSATVSDTDNDDDDSSDDDVFEGSRIQRSAGLSPVRGKKQTVRKVKNASQKVQPDKISESATTNCFNQKELEILQRLAGFIAQGNADSLTDKMPNVQNMASQQQGQGHPLGQGQVQGQSRLGNIKCFHCSNFGHFKRDCPVLKAEQNLNSDRGSQIRETQRIGTPSCRQGQFNSPDIDLN